MSFAAENDRGLFSEHSSCNIVDVQLWDGGFLN